MMWWLRLAGLIAVVAPGPALGDWFYPAVKIACDDKTGGLTILNASAYNEAGIRNTDERRGIYVPERNWPTVQGALKPKEYRCKTRSADYRVLLLPIFGRIEAGDTFQVRVVRNGEEVLPYTFLDSDPFGLDPNSYITSITVPASGQPVIQRSCQAKVHMGHLGVKCHGEGPNSPMERTR